MSEKYEVFLKEYEILCKKYGFAIESCGCCNSPFLIDVEDSDVLSWRKGNEGLEYIEFREKDEVCGGFGGGLYFIENGEIKHIKEDD